MDKSREDSPNMQVDCMHIYKLALDSCGHSQLSQLWRHL